MPVFIQISEGTKLLCRMEDGPPSNGICLSKLHLQSPNYGPTEAEGFLGRVPATTQHEASYPAD